MASEVDLQFIATALALSRRGRALSAPNPNVGCILVKDNHVLGRGWTQHGGRPHAEEMALAQAGAAAAGATAYVTLEPCAHESNRGPACTDLLIKAGVARVVAAMTDPDPRTSGKGFERLEDAGIAVARNCAETDARAAMAGWLMQRENNRPFITLKLATSMDGCIALSNGESRWITGEAARAHAHMERAFSNAILVGRGTYEADNPKLNVRLPGLDTREPKRIILTSAEVPNGWHRVTSPVDVYHFNDCHYLLVEGGAATAAAFLKADLVDRLILYRAPILIGAGKASLTDLGLAQLDMAHGVWARQDSRTLGADQVDTYWRDRA